MIDARHTRMSYMREAGFFDPHARRGEPGSWEDFAALTDSEQKQVVRALAVGGINDLRESTPGVPWRTENMDWAEAALLHLEQTGGRSGTLDPYTPLRDSGVPLHDDELAPTYVQDDPALLEAMREAGVPLRGRTSQRRELTPLAALVDAGVPLREADTPWRADERPHHQIAADLGRVIPATHPDRDHMPGLLRAGAALTSDQRHLVDALAAKHSAALRTLNAEPDQDADIQTGLQDDDWEDLQEADGGVALLRSHGIRVKGR